MRRLLETINVFFLSAKGEHAVLQYCHMAFAVCKQGSSRPFLPILVGTQSNIIPGVPETPVSHSPGVTPEQLSCSHPP